MKVLFFGQLTDITRCSALEVTNIRDTDLLERMLHERYPQLKESKYVTTVGKQVIRQHTTLNEDAEVALLPPFSGG